jgi:hypothetical protein
MVRSRHRPRRPSMRGGARRRRPRQSHPRRGLATDAIPPAWSDLCVQHWRSCQTHDPLDGAGASAMRGSRASQDGAWAADGTGSLLPSHPPPARTTPGRHRPPRRAREGSRRATRAAPRAAGRHPPHSLRLDMATGIQRSNRRLHMPQSTAAGTRLRRRPQPGTVAGTRAPRHPRLGGMRPRPSVAAPPCRAPRGHRPRALRRPLRVTSSHQRHPNVSIPGEGGASSCREPRLPTRSRTWWSAPAA